jgi:hypothetical protein
MAEENPFARLFNAAPAETTATLAQLAPGSFTDKVEIKLIAFNPKTVTYNCISYDRSREWEKKDVIVDGQPMPIPLPLEQALRCFRHASEPVLLWADLLTGDSPQERSKQALVMKEVVQNALAVTCFLGAGNELSIKAYAVLQTMSNWWSQAALTSGFPRNFSLATHLNMQDMRTLLCSRNMSDIHISDERLWREIEYILCSPYFKYTGALTDIVLGKHVLLRSGAASISWENLNRSFRAWLFILPTVGKAVSESVQDTFKLVASIDISVQRRGKGESLEMLPMIQSACQGTAAADPREFVFAVLPIVTPSERTKAPGRKPEPLPTADYTKPVGRVFVEAAKYIVSERQDLLMWWGEKPPCRKIIRSLPSWAPDWSASNPRPTVILNPNNGLRKWWDSISSPKRMFVDSDNSLHAQAHAFDQIDYVSPVFTQDNFRKLCFASFQEYTQIPGEGRMQTIDKFWRAAVLDTDLDYGERLRDNVKPPNDMWRSWLSVISEEIILQRLGCTMQELATSPSLQARARTDEACADLGRSTGQSAPIEALILHNSLGRRMFQCRSGRVGMTAIEGGASHPDTPEDAAGPRMPNFDNSLSSALGRSMMDGFQAYLAERDPAAARITSQALQGQLPGQVAPGVRSGDIVAALVGGFHPYILRPIHEVGDSELRSDSKYAFVGDCHLQGAMDGECLVDPHDLYGGWKRVPLVDILIV